ncbi:hypothetical protein [Falsirhodobacter sp. alg1]|uniref:hypothetical protein n=1 Tax=Falsirhodobacter sp. alg1 TaxID=1472418 RepID=UPI0005ED9232|nr:hypothetical protein [Falsirhodobacter sp. alg1]
MSNSDTFIDEVADELRRERLFGALKRYGWIAGLLVLVVAGGVAWTEWQQRASETEAQSFGDTLLASLDAANPEERRAVLDAASAEGDRRAVLDLMAASDPSEDKAATMAALDRVIAQDGISAVFHDLAVLRKAVVAGTDLSIDDRRALLEPISQPGQPYRALAREQLAYLDIEAGDIPAAITKLTALTTDREATQGLRQRAGQIVTALGGTISAE